MYEDSALEREATVDVDRGFFLLKYATGPALGASPVAMARPAPGSEPFIEVISAPGLVTGFLSFPGECVVVRAEQPGQLSVKVMRQSVGASMDAVFRLEPIFGVGRVSSAVSEDGAAAEVASAPAAVDGSRLRLLAHVSRRGDVEVGAGEWVGGPNAPAAIEGLEIRGSLAPDLRIEIQALVGTNPLRWMDWVAPGVYAGSRGRALVLAGLRLRLVGEAASRHVISAEALFLGSPILCKRGREIELVGGAGGDPLVGLRLEVAPAAAAAAASSMLEAVGNAASVNMALAPQRSEPRVRVFRAAARS